MVEVTFLPNHKFFNLSNYQSSDQYIFFIIYQTIILSNNHTIIRSYNQTIRLSDDQDYQSDQSIQSNQSNQDDQDDQDDQSDQYFIDCLADDQSNQSKFANFHISLLPWVYIAICIVVCCIF